MTDDARILVATDLTAASDPALVRARDHARAVGGALVVCHVVPDMVHDNPLFPQRNEVETVGVTDALRRAGDLVNEQLARVSIAVDQVKIVVESGRAADEIVRLAESERAVLIVVGARPRTPVERLLGHVAERVVRYAHAPVLVARDVPRTNRVLVATDFSPASTPAHEMAALLVQSVGADVTLLHVMESTGLEATAAALSALGSPWLPPPPSTIERLEALGETTLRSLVDRHRIARCEQVSGDPAAVIVERARAMSAEMIIVGSRGRTRLRRLALGSVAEAVVRTSTCSVLVARAAD